MNEITQNNIYAGVENVSTAPHFEFLFWEQLPTWLETNHVSLAFSTYQIGKVFLIGKKPNEPDLSIYERSLGQCMGLSYSPDGQQLVISSLYQIWRFYNAQASTSIQADYDKVYIPQLSYTTGNCDCHDIGLDKDSNIIFVNTLFNCIAKVSEKESFIPIWKPPFISRLVPYDHCHLNGLGFRDGQPRYVTGFSQTDEKEGWRTHQNNGFVMDIQTNKLLCEGLSMPHSPRWYQNKLWLLNSGTGQFGYVDEGNKTFNPLAFCPGYARGLSFHGEFAVVGLSKLREKSTLQQPTILQKTLIESATSAQCGLLLIHLTTGKTVFILSPDKIIEEIYDVIFMANTSTPMLIGFKTDEIQRSIVFDQNRLDC